MKKIKPKFVCAVCGLKANRPIQCGNKAACPTWVTVGQTEGNA